MKKVAVEFSNVSYKYPGIDNWILEDINLKIPTNSFYVLAGPTGSGKTTLLMLARGFHKEYSGKFDGDIYILGESIKNFKITELGSKIGIIFQDPVSQLHQLRVIDEVMSAPMYQGLPWSECKTRAETVINEILDRDFYNRSPNELSSGEQQKVALAACLVMNCEILILDEPFSFLSIKAAQEILKILLELKEKGKTIILATHHLEQVSRHTDRIALIDSGKVVLEGPTMDILYSKEMGKILTEPLSIKVAKALIKSRKLKEKVD
ncbi:MAG: ABC transporter ATP-binding protein [Candidatus Aenigmarchaeota archaeon]|nr:ABC transporter ATP-binding protein [Candidatus Aenigmarchaeota archaeon]